MSTYGHGPTAREQRIIDLKEAGNDDGFIAHELGLSERYVQQVVQALFAPPVTDWQAGARIGSASLLKALRLYHPERCRGAA